MGLESWFTPQKGFMKDSGKKILSQVKVTNSLLMVLYIKASIKMVSQMDMENIYGKMVKFIKVNGSMA
jgi:hypothetical protein